GHVLSERSCFVLTETGLPLARAERGQADGGEPAAGTGAGPRQAPAADERPHWDADTHTLTWRGQVVHHFRYSAKNPGVVLEVCQRHGWARGWIHIERPPDAGGDP